MKGGHNLGRRSRFAWAEYAEAFRGISFARRSSRFSCDFRDVIGFSAARGRFGCEVESPYQEGCHLSPGHSLVRAVT